MAQDETPEAENARKRAGISEAERREALTALLLRRSKLSAREALLLREVFPEILAAHHDQVSERLRKRGLAGDEVEDLVQEIFLALYAHILEDGFPDSLPSMLHLIMQRLFPGLGFAAARTAYDGWGQPALAMDHDVAFRVGAPFVHATGRLRGNLRKLGVPTLAWLA